MTLDIYIERNNVMTSVHHYTQKGRLFYFEYGTKPFLENLQGIDAVLYENLLSDKNFVIDGADLTCFEQCLAATMKELYVQHQQEILTMTFKRDNLHPFYLAFFDKEIPMNVNLFPTDIRLHRLDILWRVVLEARRLNKPIIMEYTIHKE